MDYKLAKELKDAGFPQANKNYKGVYLFEKPDGMGECAYNPPLSELIDACGQRFDNLNRVLENTWIAEWKTISEGGKTPEEAVAKLYIKLNKK